MSTPKDAWDKAEIFGKVLGAILVPVVLGWAAYAWNSQRTQLQTTAAMTQIAVGILSEQPEQADGTPDPLRAWAVAVLQNPSDPPMLSEPLMTWDSKAVARDAQELIDRIIREEAERREPP